MTKLIIGKTYSMVDSRDDREYIYKIQNVINNNNIKATGKIEDLKKAIWYLGREIENLEKEKNNG